MNCLLKTDQTSCIFSLSVTSFSDPFSAIPRPGPTLERFSRLNHNLWWCALTDVQDHYFLSVVATWDPASVNKTHCLVVPLSYKMAWILWGHIRRIAAYRFWKVPVNSRHSSPACAQNLLLWNIVDSRRLSAYYCRILCILQFKSLEWFYWWHCQDWSSIVHLANAQGSRG